MSVYYQDRPYKPLVLPKIDSYTVSMYMFNINN